MTNKQTTALVLEDRAGNYFLVPREALERGRVREEHKAEVEQLVRGQQDVQGHLDYIVFQLRTVLISEGGETAPPAAGIGQVAKKFAEDYARNPPSSRRAHPTTGRSTRRKENEP